MSVSCPWCGHILDRHLQPIEGDPTEPIAGAANICLYCARVSIFDAGPAGLYLRWPNEEEWVRLRANEAFMAAQAQAERERWRWQG